MSTSCLNSVFFRIHIKTKKLSLHYLTTTGEEKIRIYTFPRVGITAFCKVNNHQELTFSPSVTYIYMLCSDENTPHWHNELVWKDYI